MAIGHSSALFIGPANSEALIGIPFRRAKEIAARLGVQRIACGKARLIPAAPFVAALERAGGAASADAEPIDPRAEVLRALGR